MPNERRLQASDIFARIDEKRERREITSHFTTLPQDTINNTRFQGKIVKTGLPIRSRFSESTIRRVAPAPSQIPTTTREQDIKIINKPKDPFYILTPAQREIAALILQGYTQIQIAQKQGRRPDTVRIHISDMSKRLGVSSRRVKDTLERLSKGE